MWVQANKAPTIFFIRSFRKQFHASASEEFLDEIRNIFEFLSDWEMHLSYSQGCTINATFMGRKEYHIYEIQHLEKDTVKANMPVFRLISCLLVYGNPCAHCIHLNPQYTCMYTHACTHTLLLDSILE